LLQCPRDKRLKTRSRKPVFLEGKASIEYGIKDVSFVPKTNTVLVLDW